MGSDARGNYLYFAGKAIFAVGMVFPLHQGKSTTAVIAAWSRQAESQHSSPGT